MSSLAAILRPGAEPVEAAELAAIADAGRALGPAAGAMEVRDDVGLAHRRTGAETAQPIGDDRYLLIADARLDNRRELSGMLGAAEAPPGPRGDARLLLTAYRAWGEGCAARLVGDYVFVVWDRRHRRLVCARDALGMRPLHYARVGSTLLLASEAQQLLAHPAVSGRLDRLSLADYLMSRCPEPGATLFEEVRALPPGHLLVAEGTTQRLVRFWDPSEIAVDVTVDGEAAAERFLELFERAVADRVEECGSACGVLLSGGLDSSSVAAAAATSSAGEKLALYNCAFPNHPDCDEGRWVDELAGRLGMPVERLPADPGWLSPAAITSSPESPFVGWLAMLRSVLRRLRLRGGDLLLTGHGGDAVVAGSALVYADRLRSGDLGVLREVREHAAARGARAGGLLRRWGLRPLLPASVRRGLAAARGRRAVPDWIDPAFAREVGLEERLRGRGPGARPSSLARAAVEAQIERLEATLRVVHWSRRVAVGFGVEVRHPFLDRRLVELVLATPPRLLFRAGRYKELLRRAMGERLPAVVRERPSKTSFGSYLDDCWRGSGAVAIAALLRDPKLAEMGIVCADRLRQAVDRYLDRGSATMRGRLWAIITAEAWLRRLEGDRGAADRAGSSSRRPEEFQDSLRSSRGTLGELTE